MRAFLVLVLAMAFGGCAYRNDRPWAYEFNSITVNGRDVPVDRGALQSLAVPLRGEREVVFDLTAWLVTVQMDITSSEAPAGGGEIKLLAASAVPKGTEPEADSRAFTYRTRRPKPSEQWQDLPLDLGPGLYLRFFPATGRYQVGSPCDFQLDSRCPDGSNEEVAIHTKLTSVPARDRVSKGTQ